MDVSAPAAADRRPADRHYRTAIGTSLRGGAKISRAGVAHAMLAMTEDPATVKQPVAVA
ncbi:hypothetical protein [Streptomyces sp. NPDC002133]|uniref:hypothetical protein n=1 Tax=Streptomyces sp. NPDC002133 TaxID=3154409 RepID=UPI003320445B